MSALFCLLQLLTCNMCGCGPTMDAVFTGIATAWWLVASFILSVNARNATNAKVKNGQWRTAVVLLCWITMGLFGLLFIIHMIRITAKCCSRRRRGDDVDVEKAGLRPERPTSAAVEMGNEVRNRPYMLGRGKGKGDNTAQQFLSGPNI